MKKKIGVLSLLLFAGATTNAMAVPTLQLNIEGGTYYENYIINDGTNSFTVTESWFTSQVPFVLDVVGADQPDNLKSIENVLLTLSVQEEFYKDTGFITLQRVDDGVNPNPIGSLIRIDAADMHYGTPTPYPDDNKTFQPHGIFPAYYYSLSLPNLMVDNKSQQFPVGVKRPW